MKNDNKKRITVEVRQYERGVCIFHNDGKKLYVFPDTWQDMFDFLKSKDGFEFKYGEPDGVIRSANDTHWGKRFEEPTSFVYVGKQGKNIVIILTGSSTPKTIKVSVGHSFRIAYKGKELNSYWF